MYGVHASPSYPSPLPWICTINFYSFSPLPMSPLCWRLSHHRIKSTFLMYQLCKPHPPLPSPKLLGLHPRASTPGVFCIVHSASIFWPLDVLPTFPVYLYLMAFALAFSVPRMLFPNIHMVHSFPSWSWLNVAFPQGLLDWNSNDAPCCLPSGLMLSSTNSMWQVHT